MRWFILLPLCVTLVSAGLSPHADLVKQLAESAEGARYSDNVLEDAYMDVPDLITKYGYPLEVHNVITSDGYILEMHRIPYGKHNKQKDRIPVFLMHGFLVSSADFVVLGPGNALAYYLADQGYDVWLGNARGNYYSRRHRTLSPNNPVNTQFWKFSWDEIGYYDLAAFIDRIVSTTGKKLHFIGHSQGGTAFCVLASLRPEYNDKLISFQGLAPATFFIHNNFTLINALAPYEKPIETAYFLSLTGELLPRMSITTHAIVALCADGSPWQELCHSVPLIGASVTDFNTTMIPLFIGHAPAGASIRQLAHYAQSVHSNRFRRFDHGALTNLLKYGRRTPPEYDLKEITTPSYLHYSLNDKYVHYKDVEMLEYRLGNCKGKYLVERESFLHIDFTWGRDVREQLYDTLMDTIRHAENL